MVVLLLATPAHQHKEKIGNKCGETFEGSTNIITTHHVEEDSIQALPICPLIQDQ